MAPVQYPIGTPEERDGFLASGMEGGLNETYSRFDEVLERITSQ
jgi:hypothetical protein